MIVRSRRAPLWLGYLAGILTLFAACVHSVAAPSHSDSEPPTVSCCP